MKAMSGDLESSRRDLSIRHIMSVIGAKFENLLGQKEGYKAIGKSTMPAGNPNFHHRGQNNEY
jgi:hypothetical protein